jgi:Peptidase M50B-like
MRSRTLLILTVLAVVATWQLPYGKQILYPLTLFATFAHEMGHGLTALLLGQHFDQLRLYADGSGLALWYGAPGRLARALIAAGGLVGPSFAGIGLLLLAATPRRARAVLAGLAAVIVIIVALWARNPFAVVFLLLLAGFLGLAARMLPDYAAAFLVSFMAVTLCLSWFADLDYMFSAYAEVDGGRHPSDSAIIAQALWLPYWFWGGIVALFSFAVLSLGLLRVSRRRA